MPSQHLVVHPPAAQTNKGGAQQAPGESKGNYVASNLALAMWKILMRRYGWNYGHLMHLINTDYKPG